MKSVSSVVTIPSVDLRQYEPRQSDSKAMFSTAAATIALALVLAGLGLGTLSVHQHPAPSSAVVVATMVTISTPTTRAQALGGEGVEGDVLPGAAAPAPVCIVLAVPAVAAAVATRCPPACPAPAVARPAVVVLPTLAGLISHCVPAADGEAGGLTLVPPRAVSTVPADTWRLRYSR